MKQAYLHVGDLARQLKINGKELTVLIAIDGIPITFSRGEVYVLETGAQALIAEIESDNKVKEARDK